MKFFHVLLLHLVAFSSFVYASSDSDKSREFYLCVKVKKNPVEQCSNKIFGKKDSLRLLTIAKAQVASSKPPVNQQTLNYKRLQNLVRSSEEASN
jgi:hypothetical protein